MKVLVDLDFLPYIHEKYPARWRKALTVFDRIYAPADCQQLGDYGKGKPPSDNAPSGTCCSQTRRKPGGNGFLQW